MGVADWRAVSGLLQQGDAPGAQRLLQSSLTEEGDAQGWFLLGVAAQMQGDMALAETAYLQSITLNPMPAAPRHNLAVVYLQRSKYALAEPLLRTLVAERPADVKCRSVLASVLSSTERWDEAIVEVEVALDLTPTDRVLRSAYWGLLSAMPRAARLWWQVDRWLWRNEPAERLERAVYAHLSASLLGCADTVDPISIDGLVGLAPAARLQMANYAAAALGWRGEREAALGILAPLLSAPWPADVAAELKQLRLHASFLRLGTGDWLPAWTDLRLRGEAQEQVAQMARFGDVPMWEGQPIEGKRLLIHGEQGMGDIIMCARFLPLLSARCAEVQLNLKPGMMRLLGLTGGGVEGVGDLMDTPRRPDYQIRMMDVLGVLGVTPDTVPNTVPYLDVPPSKRQLWQARLAQLPGVRIGLVWAGNPNHRMDCARSAALDDFMPLLAVPGVSWVSLQVGDMACQEADGFLERANWLSLGQEISDLQDTAAIVEQLDLVIAVDTGVAHLTGALGRPVWTLLPTEGQDWRWMSKREDTPWYPSMRLLRKPLGQRWGRYIRDSVRPALIRHLLSLPSERVTPSDQVLLRTLQNGDGAVLTGEPQDWSPSAWDLIYAMVVDKRSPVWGEWLAGWAAQADMTIGICAQAVLACVRPGDRAVFVESVIDSNIRLPHWVYRIALQLVMDVSELDALEKLLAVASQHYPGSDEFAVRAAQLARARERFVEAGEGFAAVARRRPRDPRIARGLGLVAEERGDLTGALDHFERAVRFDPDQFVYWHELGRIALNAGATGLALAALRRAEVLGAGEKVLLMQARAAVEEQQPAVAKSALAQLRDSLFRSGRRKAADMGDTLAHLHYTGWDSEAEVDSVAPETPAGMTRSEYLAQVRGPLSLLRYGDEAGWALYARKYTPKPLAVPFWDTRTPVERLLVYQDQGLGDVIQSIRVLPALVGDARYRLLVGKDIAPIIALQDWAANADVIWEDREAAPDQYDAAAPLMVTYALLNAEHRAVSMPVPYLKVPESHVSAWRDRLRPVNGLRVGLVWGGNPRHKLNMFRSTMLRAWLPLASVSGVTLISLQKDEPSNQALEVPEIPLVNVARDCHSMLDTAAAIMALDLVIAVDTGVAHLAAALGQQVWIVLGAAGTDWRWGVSGDRTDLYPTVRLFRQQSLDEPWVDVMQRVAQALGELAAH